MSYEKDRTYLREAIRVLEDADDSLRRLPDLKRSPVVIPTLWGDPQIVLVVDSSISPERRVEIIELTGETPVVFKVTEE